MRRGFVLLVLTPLVVYPVLALSLLVADAVAGERFLWLYLRHEQRALWDTFWADYATATPIMYLLIMAVALILFTAGRVRGRAVSPFLVVSAFALLGWIAASYLTGGAFGSGHVALAAAGIVTGLPVAVALRWLDFGNTTGARVQ